MFSCCVSGAEVTCVMSAIVEDCVMHNSWCTCTTPDGLCYSSTIVVIDDTGTQETFYEYGCLSYLLTCPNSDVIMTQFSANTFGYQVFECCSDGDFCNENLTAVFDPSLLPTLPESTPTPTHNIGECWWMSSVRFTEKYGSILVS